MSDSFNSICLPHFKKQLFKVKYTTIETLLPQIVRLCIRKERAIHKYGPSINKMPWKFLRINEKVIPLQFSLNKIREEKKVR